MRVTNEQARSATKADHITGNTTTIIKEYARDLLEARELIKEMRQAMLEISQETIASVCEDVRQKAHNLWEKSKEYAQ